MKPNRAKEALLTQERLQELLNYNDSTGVFTWRISRPGCRADGIAGSLNKVSGYIETRLDGKSYQAHRLSWLYMHGKFPDNQIDHINGVRDDNRIINLRDITHVENGKNQVLRKTNTSGVTGLHWNEIRNKWQAYIKINGKSRHLGLFTSKKEAIAARQAANIKYDFYAGHGKIIVA